MNVRFIEKPCRFARGSVIVLAIALTIYPQLDSSDLMADEYPTTCNYVDELCGWTDDDSQPQQMETNAPVGKIVTTIAAAVSASTGVSWHQMVEPFAMVGPYVENAPQMVEFLQAWWKSAVALVETQQALPTDEAIEQLAALEPIDVEKLGPSVLVTDGVLVTERARSV